MFYTSTILSKLILAFSLVSCCVINGQASIQPFSVMLFGQEIELEYDSDMIYPYKIRIEELALRQAYDHLERRSSYQVLLNSVQRKAADLMLNDWLYVQLIRECSKRIYGSHDAPKSELTNYFLLGKSGYDVRLTYRNNAIHTNIYVKDILYEIPLIEERGRQYASISKTRIERNSGQSMYLLDHSANPKGRACLFGFNRWPSFCDVSTSRQITFVFQGRLIELDINYSKQVAELLNSYPLVDEYWYMEAPLSFQLRESLVPQLQKLMEGLSTQSSLELLVAFTRSGFDYKEDHAAFGKSKPMVADELFYYPFSDCEDRSALFFSLVKTLLDLPMIVIAYEDHLSIAVSAPGLKGRAINYQGRSYVFCDPTGPKASSVIGKIPDGYENKDFEIIGKYNSF